MSSTCAIDLGSHWFWSYDFSVGDTWNEFDGFTGDAAWVSVYPGRTWNQHVPTLAWESLREARDDHRYAATLEKLLAESPGREATGSRPSTAGCSTNCRRGAARAPSRRTPTVPTPNCRATTG
jgi:hypothetical protein